MSDRTFRLTRPHMTGKDIELAQLELRSKLRFWGVPDYPLVADGDYGVATRSAYMDVCYGMGILEKLKDPVELAHGITPALRTKIRNARLSPEEKERHEDRAAWRDRLAAQHAGGGTAAILAKIITHANGFTGGHDGVDLICPPNSPAFAMVQSRVVRVSDDWWGASAPRDESVRDKGDGIVILRSLVSVGPIVKGDLFGYGHGEKPRVKVGDIVVAGQRVCDAGLANAWHLHLTWFRGNPGLARDGGPKGIGNRDPWPAVDHCRRHAA